MPDRDRRAHEKIVVRGKRGVFGQTEEVGCRGVERCILLHSFGFDVQLLERHRADDGQNTLSDAVNFGASGGAAHTHDVVDEFSADVEGETLCRLDRLQEPCLVALLFLLRICGDVVGRTMDVRRGDKLTGKNTFSRAQPLFGLPAHAAERHRCIARLSHGNRQAIEYFWGQRAARYIRRERERTVQQLRRIRLHDNRIGIACRRCVCTAKHRPDRRLDRAQAKGTFRADDGAFCISICEKILRGEDVGVCGIPSRLPIGGELHEEVVVAGILLRTCEEIIKERRSLLVIAPKCAEIVAHNISFPFRAVRRTTWGVQHASRARTPRCLRSRGRSHGHADRRISADPHYPQHSSHRAHGCAGRSPHVHR